jgi:hypothetical protein
LIGAASIIVPFWNLWKWGHFFVKCSSLWSECDTWAINPNVLSNDFTALIDVKEVLSVLVVQIVSVRDHLQRKLNSLS